MRDYAIRIEWMVSGDADDINSSRDAIRRACEEIANEHPRHLEEAVTHVEIVDAATGVPEGVQ